MEKYRTGKSVFDISSLLCVNADLCLLSQLPNKFVRMPPMFLHTSMKGNRSSSDIAGLADQSREAQLSVTELAREVGFQWARSSYELYSRSSALAVFEKVPKDADCTDNDPLKALVGDIPVLFIGDRSCKVVSSCLNATFVFPVDFASVSLHSTLHNADNLPTAAFSSTGQWICCL